VISAIIAELSLDGGQGFVRMFLEHYKPLSILGYRVSKRHAGPSNFLVLILNSPPFFSQFLIARVGGPRV